VIGEDSLEITREEGDAMNKREKDGKGFISRRNFLKWTGGMALALPFAHVRRAHAAEEKTVTVAWDTEIDTLDPASFKTIGAYNVVANIYDTPIYWGVSPIPGKEGFFLSKPGDFVPRLAESWTREKDGATIVFKVRKGVKFPTGNPVTAHAFKYSFDRGLLSPGYMRLIIPTLLMVDSPDQFEVRDDYTFAIKMKKPNPMDMDIIALSNNAILDPAEVKKHATSDDPWAANWLKRNPIGGGPYTLAKNIPGVEVVLEANKGYWQKPPYFERIVLKFVPSEADRVMLIKRKAVDMVVGRPGLSPKNVKSLEGEPGLKIFSVPDTTCHFVSMNQKRPPYDNIKVRQAINYAIPMEAIMPNVLFGYGRLMKSPVPDLTPTYDLTANKYKFDLEKAKALLKEAGYEKGFTTNMAIRLGWIPHEHAAIWMQREFEKIGIKVNIVKETDATFRQSMTQGLHEISIESWQSWVNDPLYHIQWNFHSKAKATNVNFYSNPEVDKLLEENMHETNLDKRNAASRELQKIIIEEAVWGFLWYDNWTRVMKTDLYGLEKRWDTFERYYSLFRKA